MKPQRWTGEHVVAVVEVLCGVLVAVWLSILGGGSVLLTVFGLVVGAALVAWGIRRWRRANRAAVPDPEPTPTPTTTQPTTTAPVERPRPVTLSPDGEREAARVVTVLADAGVFAPDAPDPADLHAPLADYGEPVTAEGVLSALEEASYYVPGFDAARYTANLAFHDSHGEQFVSTVDEQVADLVRLAGGGLDDVSADVALADSGNSPRIPTRIRLRIGADEQVLAYDGAAKYLSTVVHAALARASRERRTGRRLAWLWSDQGVWISSLPDGAVAPLNGTLGRAAGEGWEWVDEQDPIAAGDMYPVR